MRERGNKKFKDGSRFGEIFRALAAVFTGVDDWRPTISAAHIAAEKWWVEGADSSEILCPNIKDKNAIMQWLIDYYRCESYLELGGQKIDPNSTFRKIKCKLKHSVDPDPEVEADFIMTSDDYFEKNNGDQKYGLVFIDAWHEHKQVYRDIINSLDCLEEDGIIVLHDMIPITRDLEKDPHRTGSCWKAFAELRKRSDLEMGTLVPPWGSEDSLSIIKKGSQQPFSGEIEFSYDFLLDNVEDLMNTMDIDCFFKVFLPQCTFHIEPNPNYPPESHEKLLKMNLHQEWFDKHNLNDDLTPKTQT